VWISKGVVGPPSGSAYRIRNCSRCRGQQFFHKKDIVRPAEVPVEHIRKSPPNRAGIVSKQNNVLAGSYISECINGFSHVSNVGGLRTT